MNGITKKITVCFFLYSVVLSSLSAGALLIAGTSSGLYDISDYVSKPLLKNVNVKKICKTNGGGYFILTDDGIAFSKNLKDFQFVNGGLPEKTIKEINNGKKKLVKKIQRLVDLEVHPEAPYTAVTATSSSVFLTEDGGKTWKNLGCNGTTNGIKAVAVANLEDKKQEKKLTIFVSHSIYGTAWKQPHFKNVWFDISSGLAKGPEGVEEVGDISVHVKNGVSSIYAVQTFLPKFYKLNWEKKKFTVIHDYNRNEEKSLLCTGSICASDYSLIGINGNGFFELPLSLPKPIEIRPVFSQQDSIGLKTYLKLHNINCLWVSGKITHHDKDISLSDFWLLNYKEKSQSGFLKTASGRKGLYLPVHQAASAKGFAAHLSSIKKNKLNAVVIDMKDDYGFVRYNSEIPAIKAAGALNPFINIEEFVKKTKKEGIYLIARIVVFKDKKLYAHNNYACAVKNANGTPWQGYTIVDGTRKNIGEFWVDPYNEAVWKYNTDIAKELVEKGFDEIQFDYIRFPTDGANLREACYPAKDAGMDKESALMSFLSYARKEINAPISIDIYGANGWYRTGARTGQDVEILAEYVDVICPMFYPSHFSQTFLAHAPAELRPYRIYYRGSFRNKFIASASVIVRPWVQAFYLPVSYDKKYYGIDYVKRQVIGIRDSIDEGYIYWNNSGRYADIRPDGENLK